MSDLTPPKERKKSHEKWIKFTPIINLLFCCCKELYTIAIFCLLPPSLPLAPSRVASAPGVGLRSFSLCSFSTFAAKLGFCSDLDGFLVKGFFGAFWSEGAASISLDFLSWRLEKFNLRVRNDPATEPGQTSIFGWTTYKYKLNSRQIPLIHLETNSSTPCLPGNSFNIFRNQDTLLPVLVSKPPLQEVLQHPKHHLDAFHLGQIFRLV